MPVASGELVSLTDNRQLTLTTSSMLGPFQVHLAEQLDEIRLAGLYKTERPLSTPQGVHIRTAEDQEVLNLCANNYLGLADHPEVIEAAKVALERWGFGLASVRFICGTQEVHKELESALTQFHRTEATILYGSCFDANGGLFETLLSSQDAVISDELNHASIIDGIRLCKAQRYRYRHGDPAFGAFHDPTELTFECTTGERVKGNAHTFLSRVRRPPYQSLASI